MAHTRDGAARVMEHEQGGTIILCGETAVRCHFAAEPEGGGRKVSVCFVIITPTEYSCTVHGRDVPLSGAPRLLARAPPPKSHETTTLPGEARVHV